MVYSESAHSKATVIYKCQTAQSGMLSYPQLLLLRIIACLEEALHLIACITGRISTHSLQQYPSNVYSTLLPVT